MTTETWTATSLDELEGKIQERIGQLRDRRQQLALDALSDKAAVSKLADVERRLGAAEAELQRLSLARAEQERRAAEEHRAAENEQQATALTAARKLQARRQTAARAVDEAAARHVEAVCEYAGICREQEATLRAAGRSGQADVARPFGFAIEASFAFALQRAHGLLGVSVWDRLPVIPPGHQKPLAESDTRVIEPLAE